MFCSFFGIYIVLPLVAAFASAVVTAKYVRLLGKKYAAAAAATTIRPMFVKWNKYWLDFKSYVDLSTTNTLITLGPKLTEFSIVE